MPTQTAICDATTGTWSVSLSSCNPPPPSVDAGPPAPVDAGPPDAAVDGPSE
jgi:hypothetical protein